MMSHNASQSTSGKGFSLGKVKYNYPLTNTEVFCYTFSIMGICAFLRLTSKTTEVRQKFKPFLKYEL
ncbi:hypothetical protein GLO73106DRAFT_00021000 [Gloeocapsa sp. PCC 73106]|nr:hypothetical protein GLO73106DRAFT_00021000 [Gloeocapsa sp. PCC 73106]